MNESRRAVIVGCFIFVGLVFLVAGILIVGNLHETFKRKMNVVALFDDVSGLQAGNNIWFSGVKIGTVSKIEFYAEARVKVIMKIETNAQEYIKKNAKVKVSTDGLIGNKILVIYGGTLHSREVQEGDTLMVDKTFSSDDMMNTLQESNNNLLTITSNIKTLSNKIANGEGTVGLLLNERTVYDQINTMTASLQQASIKTQQLVASLQGFSEGLNKDGTLAHELITDTIVFNSIKNSMLQLQQMSDTATVFVSTLKQAAENPNSPVGVLLHDTESGQQLKTTIKNLESSSQKLDENLEAAKHSFLLKGYFKDKEKEEKKKKN